MRTILFLFALLFTNRVRAQEQYNYEYTDYDFLLINAENKAYGDKFFDIDSAWRLRGEWN